MEIFHEVLLADLISLAVIWEISDENLGLEIDAKGELVPKLIDEEDDMASLSEMIRVAEENFPDNHALDLVVLVHETTAGNIMTISTVDLVCLAQGRLMKSRRWTFTNEYLNQMN